MDLQNMPHTELRQLLDTQQKHLLVIGLNFKMNGVRTARAAQKYDNYSMARINEVINRILAISGELRKHAIVHAKYHTKSQAPASERELNLLSFSQYHPVIQRAFIRKLKAQGDIFSAQWARVEKEQIVRIHAEEKLKVKRARFNPKRK